MDEKNWRKPVQLKRETDYALRLLLCLRAKATSPETAISVRELAMETEVPRRIAGRILLTLCESDLIASVPRSGQSGTYYLERDVNLLELIRCIEGRAELFAAFDSSHRTYQTGKKQFETIEESIANILSSVKLEDFS